MKQLPGVKRVVELIFIFSCHWMVTRSYNHSYFTEKRKVMGREETDLPKDIAVWMNLIHLQIRSF